MVQRNAWEKEYREQTFLTLGDTPQKDLRRFLKFLKKEQGIDITGKKVLDLGAGTGRNSNFLASLGCEVSAMEIASNALEVARERAEKDGLDVSYILASIGEKYPFENESFDIILDVMSSNSLNDEERQVYLEESHRVLKAKGYFFVKALAKEGDKNVKKLLQQNPGEEKDTYIMPQTGIVERAFTREDFLELYQKYFTILKLDKKTNYTRFNNQKYKRNFWLCYLQKK